MGRYRFVIDRTHPKANTHTGQVYEHIRIVTAVLGKDLPSGVVVHHVNGDPRDNRNCNLVICQDQAYHMELHRRQRALLMCGHGGYYKCRYCNKWDDPANLYLSPPNRKGRVAHHPECRRVFRREQRAKGIIV